MNLPFHKTEAHLNYHRNQQYHHSAMVEGYKCLMIGTETVSLYHTDQVLKMLKQKVINGCHSFNNNFSVRCNEFIVCKIKTISIIIILTVVSNTIIMSPCVTSD